MMKISPRFVSSFSGIDEETKAEIMKRAGKLRARLFGVDLDDAISALIMLHHHERAFHHREMAKALGDAHQSVSNLQLKIKQQEVTIQSLSRDK